MFEFKHFSTAINDFKKYGLGMAVIDVVSAGISIGFGVAIEPLGGAVVSVLLDYGSDYLKDSLYGSH